MNAVREVEAHFAGERAKKIGSVANFVRDQRVVHPDDDYVGLANVQANTGERVESTEKDGEGSCFEFAKDDVLFGRLRPYLNKVYLTEKSGVCSTEFHVIRVHRDDDGLPEVIPEYLAAVLRSTLVVAQTRHMMTGNTHPRLANEDVVDLVIPVPDRDIQEDIADEVFRRRVQVRRLREQAESVWNEGTRHFELAVLGLPPAVHGRDEA
jgi:hypothetical protein